MKKKDSKRLVIDTSIASAAGGKDAKHPLSTNCRDFLDSVLVICHKIVVTEPLNEEWTRNASRFTRRWLISMKNRKKLEPLIPYSETDFYKCIDLLEKQSYKDAALKDAFLIEAAIATDAIIISLDNNAKKVFKKLQTKYPKINSIMWVNPKTDSIDELRKWLEDGAMIVEKWQLGN